MAVCDEPERVFQNTIVFADNGRVAQMPTVKFLNEKQSIEVPAGSNLRKEALKAGVELYQGIHKHALFNCHGLSVCGSCRVLIKKGMENTNAAGVLERFTPIHNPLMAMAKIGHEDEMRLACQTTVNGDIEVETCPPMNWHGDKFWA